MSNISKSFHVTCFEDKLYFFFCILTVFSGVATGGLDGALHLGPKLRGPTESDLLN